MSSGSMRSERSRPGVAAASTTSVMSALVCRQRTSWTSVTITSATFASRCAMTDSIRASASRTGPAGRETRSKYQMRAYSAWSHPGAEGAVPKAWVGSSAAVSAGAADAITHLVVRVRPATAKMSGAAGGGADRGRRAGRRAELRPGLMIGGAPGHHEALGVSYAPRQPANGCHRQHTLPPSRPALWLAPLLRPAAAPHRCPSADHHRQARTPACTCRLAKPAVPQ